MIASGGAPGMPSVTSGIIPPPTTALFAVSVANRCEYCIHSHTASARKKGITPAQFGELQAVIGLANEANRLANGYRVPVDPQFANG